MARSRNIGTTNEAQLIRREGEYWTVVFDGMTCRLRDGRGIRYLAVLLAHPHEAIAALVLEHAGGDGCHVARPPSVPAHIIREHARVNVRRAVAAALRRIVAVHPPLGRHLGATIKTGAFCRYTPDPRGPLRWTE